MKEDPETTSGREDVSGEELPLEGRLKRLEEIVRLLEGEELELDRALALFEEGVLHTREAEKALAAAELRVEELLGREDDVRTRAVEEEEEDRDG